MKRSSINIHMPQQPSHLTALHFTFHNRTRLWIIYHRAPKPGVHISQRYISHFDSTPYHTSQTHLRVIHHQAPKPDVHRGRASRQPGRKVFGGLVGGEAGFIQEEIPHLPNRRIRSLVVCVCEWCLPLCVCLVAGVQESACCQPCRQVLGGLVGRQAGLLREKVSHLPICVRVGGWGGVGIARWEFGWGWV